MRFSSKEVVAFLFAGAINTALTYLVYLALLQVVPYRVAYTASYTLGIFTSYYLNARLVFRQPVRWQRALAYPLTYALPYFPSLALLWLFVERLGMDRRLAPILIIVLMTPFTFVFSRYIIRGGRERRT
jgi:putative flippase GtrA